MSSVLCEKKGASQNGAAADEAILLLEALLCQPSQAESPTGAQPQSSGKKPAAKTVTTKAPAQVKIVCLETDMLIEDHKAIMARCTL